MKKIKKRWKFLIAFVIFVMLVWLNNTNLFSDKTGTYKWLAHRGLAQTFDISEVEWDTNTAAIIYEPEHHYLENTLESMIKAFEHGAHMVECDIQRTKDNQLAVFHDSDLAMRTDGSGMVKDKTMDALKQLDIGYGYTADGGETYPFRGKGVGLMPELTEVLEQFPDQALLIDLKDGDLETAKILWAYLKDMPPERLNLINVYGSHGSMLYLREQSNTLRVLSKKKLKHALLQYELIGWTGYVPKAIHNMELHIPLIYAKYLWGWPHKFVERMNAVNTTVVIVEGNGKWSEGFDSKESLEKIPKGFTGYIWTNRMDRVGPIGGNE